MLIKDCNTSSTTEQTYRGCSLTTKCSSEEQGPPNHLLQYVRMMGDGAAVERGGQMPDGAEEKLTAPSRWLMAFYHRGSHWDAQGVLLG